MKLGIGPVCRARNGKPIMPRNNTRSAYRIAKVSADCIWIVDLDIGKSVTNDAENVTKEIQATYPGRRIIYRDTSGSWDELKHEAGRFTGFAPASELALEDA